MQFIDITAVNAALRQAIRIFVSWLNNNGVTVGGVNISFFDMILTGFAVYLILDCFIPWGGGDED